MTPDDLISLHKACQDVVESMNFLDEATQKAPSDKSQIMMQIESLRQGVLSLAVVQRDIIKSVLESFTKSY